VCSKERAKYWECFGLVYSLKNELSSDYNAHASLSVGCRIFNDAIMSPTHRNVSSRFDYVSAARERTLGKNARAYALTWARCASSLAMSLLRAAVLACDFTPMIPPPHFLDVLTYSSL
jgi:hypothetical protein